MSHVNIMKTVRWEIIKLCESFGQKRPFSRASGILESGRVVLCEEGMTSWSLDPCISDAVDIYSHIFIILVPHGAVNMCLPEEGCELW